MRYLRYALMGLLVLAAMALAESTGVDGNGKVFGGSSISDLAYPLLAERTTDNQTNFYVYQDADSGFNHGFPSGFFASSGPTRDKIDLDASCVNDLTQANGCSTDPESLDRERGTVLRVSFDALLAGEFAGVNIEEPENWGADNRGTGYDLSGATHVVFDVRSPDGISVQFGVGGKVSDYIPIPASDSFDSSMQIALNTLKDPVTGLTSPPDLSDANILFAVATNVVHAPDGGTVLLDNIRFDPVPSSQQDKLSFPLGNETFGVLPLEERDPGRVPFPSDQVLRNLTTTYESALTLLALLARGTPEDLSNARLIADAFDYALYNDNHGDFIPVAPDESTGCFDGLNDAQQCGLHNGYMSGDIALLNDQGPGQGQTGDVRLAGFSCGVSLTGFCLVLDGATGGNNAFAILALVAAYQQFMDQRYLDDARTIGNWIERNLKDDSGTGYGGYFLGYPDEGKAKVRIPGKSIENNADIFAAFVALARIERELGNTVEAHEWTMRANVAGDFVMEMFNPVSGCFYVGTVPVNTDQGLGIDPTGPQQGDDVINAFAFLDANTFATLALAESPRYRNAIDWRRPVQCVLDNFAQSITVDGPDFHGFNIVKNPTPGPNGIAWEFTAQAVASMRFVDHVYHESGFEGQAASYLSEIRKAQTSAPFGDGRGLVASILQDGDALPPIEQCLSTPFQCIPERVGLAATTWTIFAEQNFNPLSPCAVADLDCDGVPDASDNCPAWPNSDQSLPPWPVTLDGSDTDCDGFTTDLENFMGTDPLSACAATGRHDGIDNDGNGLIDEAGEGTNDEDPDSLPTDFDDDQDTDTIDVLFFKPHMNKVNGKDPGYSVRFDFDADGDVDIIDVLFLRGRINTSCVV